MNYETAYKEGYGDLLQFDSGAGYKSHVELEKAEKERVGFSEVVIFTEPILPGTICITLILLWISKITPLPIIPLKLTMESNHC